MRTSSKRLLLAVLVLSLAVPGVAGPAGKASKAPAARDLARIADLVVRESLAVKEGEFVAVYGHAHSQELLDELAVAIARQGAAPAVMSVAEKTSLRLVTDVPEKYDSMRGSFMARTAELVGASIDLDDTLDPTLFKSVPAPRLVAVQQAYHAASVARRTRKVRVVSIGNGLYPSDERARLLDVPRPELEKLFWAALAVPPSKLAEEAAAVKRVLAAGREVRVTNPAGTDLRFSIEARPVFVSDGIVKAEDVERGSNATWLPAGEVFLAPVRGTAEGKLVLERQAFGGGMVEGLTVVFEKGRVVSHTAKPSPAYARFQEVYAAAPEGKDELGVLDLGVNRGAVRAKGALRSYVPAGNVTLGIGQNVWAGGEADLSYAAHFMLTGATVTVDGKPIVERGVLVPAPTM